MTDTMRWRYGDTNPVVTKPVAAGVAIEIGDLVAQDSSGNVIPAKLQTWTHRSGDNAGRVSFRLSRRGDAAVVGQRQRHHPRRHDRRFRDELAAATFELGDLVAPDKDTGNVLLNQQVVAVGTGNESKAIGRVAGRVNPAGTIVLVSIVSTKLLGGPQAAM